MIDIKNYSDNDFAGEKQDFKNEHFDDEGVDESALPLYVDDVMVEEIVQFKTSKKIRDLQTFFKTNVAFITEKGDQSTNIINMGDKKTYNMPLGHVGEFFSLIDNCRKENRMIHYSERQATKSGIMLDFDRYQSTKQRQITERHFNRLLRYIAIILNDTLELEPRTVRGEVKFHAFVIQKPEITIIDTGTAAGKYKDGFHILIPELMVTRGVKKFLIQEIQRREVMSKVFADIENISPADEMLDKMSASVPVMFFGNSKVNKPAYKLIAAYAIILDIELKSCDTNSINIDEVIGWGESYKYNLVYELSLSFYFKDIEFNGAIIPTWLNKQELDYKVEHESKIQLIVEKTAKDIIPQEDILGTENSLSTLTLHDPEASWLRKILLLLDISFATDYEKWFKVICAIAHTSRNYKPLALEFSQRQPNKWSPIEIDRVWDEATNGFFNREPITKRSLIFWAKQSCPDRFREIQNENYHNLLNIYALTYEGIVEHAMIAHILKIMLGDKFIVDVTDMDGKRRYCWYEFVLPEQQHRKGEVFKWRQEFQPDVIHLYMSRQLPKVYANVLQKIKDRREAAENDNTSKYWSCVEKTFKKYTTRLFNDGFKNGVINQANYEFRQRGFIDELDADPDIIGVGNGVLKLGPESRLIRGFHEYKISKYTEVDFIPYNPNNPWIQLVEKAFRDIFPESDVYEFVWFYLSLCLDGHNAAPMILFLVGGGNNGKSFVIKCLEGALGSKYSYKAPHTLLTAPVEKSNSPNSAYFSCKGKRAITYTEPEKNEHLYTSRLKSMTSPDTQTGRGMFKDQENFTIIGNQICCSNYDFITDCTDHGLWKRIKYYKCKVRFCLKPDPKNPYEKIEDRKFTDIYIHDPEFKRAVLSVLVHYNQRLHLEYDYNIKKVPCPTIEAETEQFRNRQDTINRFITQMFVKSPRAEEYPLAYIASKYIDWYNENISRMQQTSSITEIVTSLENSKLSQNVIHRPDGATLLVGHRIKERAIDLPAEDETPLCANLQQTIQDIIAAQKAVMEERELRTPNKNTENIKENNEITTNTFTNEIIAMERAAIIPIQREPKFMQEQKNNVKGTIDETEIEDLLNTL